MNIITNQCLGGHIYQYNKTTYNNPFIWCSIKLSDFIRLMQLYKNIDYANISAELESDYFKNDTYVKIKLDDAIDISFIHYLLRNDISVRKYGNWDMGGKDIIEYAINKWKTRTTSINTEQPIFIYDDKINYTDIDLHNFIDCNNGCKKMLITARKEYLQYNSEQLKVMLKPVNNYAPVDELKDILENNELKTFLGL